MTDELPHSVPISIAEGWADRLRKARTERRISQSLLARRVGISQSAVADYERGRSSPKFETLLKLAKEMGVEPRWLVEGKPDPAPTGGVLPGKLAEFEWTDSTSLEEHYQELCIKIDKTYSEAGYPTPDPVWFSLTCRQLWSFALSSSQDIPLSERIDHLIQQTAMMLRVIAKDRRGAPNSDS